MDMLDKRTWLCKCNKFERKQFQMRNWVTGKEVVFMVPNFFGTRDQFYGGQFFHGWVVGGGAKVRCKAQEVMCVAHFLRGHRLVLLILGLSPGVEDSRA